MLVMVSEYPPKGAVVLHLLLNFTKFSPNVANSTVSYTLFQEPYTCPMYFRTFDAYVSEHSSGAIKMHVPRPQRFINRRVFNLSFCIITVFSRIATTHNLFLALLYFIMRVRVCVFRNSNLSSTCAHGRFHST